MNKILAISGWGQAHNSLAEILPEGEVHLDYTKFSSVEDFFASIRNIECDVLVGWSLGGQLALRAISENILKPKLLVLLATPYQFVAGKDIKCAMDRDTFEAFLNHFKQDPEKTLKRFLTLISRNDEHAHDVLAKLRTNCEYENITKWLYWLEELESFSCNSIDFSAVPQTLAIHGRDDTLVDITQTGLFRSLIKNFRLEVFSNCGHAPHLHDTARVRELIKAGIEIIGT